MGAYGGPDIITDGLLIALDAGSERSYSGSGTSVSNIIDNSTYTLTNGLVKASDKGGTWDYDGVDDYIQGPTTSFGALSAYTIAFWCRRDAESRMYIGTSNNHFYWYGDNSWRWVTSNGSAELYYSKNVSIPAGTWGYYVATYDGTNTKVYRQGVYQDNKASTGTVNFDAGTFRFGYYAGSSTYAFNGLGGNIYLYNRALSAAEVTQNYNAQKNRFI